MDEYAAGTDLQYRQEYRDQPYDDLGRYGDDAPTGAVPVLESAVEGRVEELFGQAVGEQLAEQRMIRQALTEFDQRLESLERVTTERLESLERQAHSRMEAVERVLTERLGAFETVLRRVVDRMSGNEQRLLDGLEHNEKVVRAQLEALRSALDATSERLTDTVEHSGEVQQAQFDSLRSAVEATADSAVDAVQRSERVVQAHIESIKPVAEAAVVSAMGPALDRAIDDLREILETTGRRLTRDVNRIPRVIAQHADADNAFPGFVPVAREVDLTDEDDDEPVQVSAPAVPASRPRASTDSSGRRRRRPGSRRPRPLRARRVDDEADE